MGMGINLATAYITVQTNLGAFNRNLYQVRRQLDDMFGVLLGAKFASGLFMVGLDTIVIKSIQAARSLEAMTTELEILTGSASEAAEIVKGVIEFAARTPFTIPDLLSVTEQMVNFGERGQKLMKTLKMLGDAAMGNREKFNTLALVFNQIRGRAYLVAQDFYQLSQRGILSMDDLAKYLGKTRAETAKLQQAGKISFEAVRGTLEMLTSAGGRYANMMEKMSQTFEGLWSTSIDVFNMAFQSLGAKFIPIVGRLLKVFIYLGFQINEFIKSKGDIIVWAATVGAALATVTFFATGLILILSALNVSIKAFMIGSSVATGVIVVAMAITALAVAYNKYLIPSQTKLTQLWYTAYNIVGSRLVPILQLLTDTVKQLFEEITEGFLQAIGPFRGFLEKFDLRSILMQNRFEIDLFFDRLYYLLQKIQYALVGLARPATKLLTILAAFAGVRLVILSVNAVVFPLIAAFLSLVNPVTAVLSVFSAFLPILNGIGILLVPINLGLSLILTLLSAISKSVSFFSAAISSAFVSSRLAVIGFFRYASGVFRAFVSTFSFVFFPLRAAIQAFLVGSLNYIILFTQAAYGLMVWLFANIGSLIMSAVSFVKTFVLASYGLMVWLVGAVASKFVAMVVAVKTFVLASYGLMVWLVGAIAAKFVAMLSFIKTFVLAAYGLMVWLVSSIGTSLLSAVSFVKTFVLASYGLVVWLVSSIGAVFLSAVSFVKTFVLASYGLMVWLVSSIGPMLWSAFTALPGLIGAALYGGARLLIVVFSNVISLLPAILAAVFRAAFVAIPQLFWVAIKMIPGLFLSVISAIPQIFLAGFRMIGPLLLTAVMNLPGLLMGALTGGFGAVTGIFGFLAGGITAAFSAALSAVVPIVIAILGALVWIIPVVMGVLAVVKLMNGGWTYLLEYMKANRPVFDEMGMALWDVFMNAKDGLMWLADTAVWAFNQMIYWVTFAADWMMQALLQAFGFSTTNAQGFFDTVVGYFQYFLDWLSIITTDWTSSWEYMQVKAYQYLLTIWGNILWVFNNFIPLVLGVASGVISVFSDLAFNIIETFKPIGSSLAAIFKAAWESAKAAISGGDFTKVFMDTMIDEMAKIPDSAAKSMADIGTNARTAFDQAFQGSGGTMVNPMQAQIDVEAAKAAALWDKMRQKRDDKRMERLWADAEWGNVEKKLKIEEKKPKPKPEDKPLPSVFSMKAGKYGFQEFGDKIQETLLKDAGGDKQDRMIGLAESGNKTQENILKAVKANKPVGLV